MGVTHLLINYIDPSEINNHVDPDFKNLVYGDVEARGYILLNNLGEGSYIFFNTTIGDKRYITGYYYFKKLLLKGRDDDEINKVSSDAKTDEIIVIGDKEKSKILTKPLLLDKELITTLKSIKADEKYFDKKFKENKTELMAINYKTRTHRKLSEEDKDILLNLCENRG